jgi:uncharacterized delta-60 repeat protein
MLALALTAALALSSPGTLDRSFGHDGRVVTPTSGVPRVAGLESLPRGKVLLAGTIGDRAVVLIRYRRNGRLDKGFGRKGVSTIRFDKDVTATDTLLQPNGRLVVAGSLGDDTLVLRFDRAGHLDPSFDQDGIAVVSFGASTTSAAKSVALQPDGAVVVLAQVQRGEFGGLGVTRVDASGDLDRTFGEQGFVRMEPQYYWESVDPGAVGVLPDGRLAVAYAGSGPSSSSADLLWLPQDGSTDPASGYSSIYVGGSSISDVAVLPSTGRVVLAGVGLDFQPYGQEFLPSVAAFDGGAKKPAWRAALVDSTKAEHQIWTARLALDAQGRALVAGFEEWWQASKEGRLQPRIHRADMLVARVRANGKLDRCFGNRAIARVRFPSKLSKPAGITVAKDGDIVIAGPPQYIDPHPRHRFELARLHAGACRR